MMAKSDGTNQGCMLNKLVISWDADKFIRNSVWLRKRQPFKHPTAVHMETLSHEEAALNVFTQKSNEKTVALVLD